MNSRKQSYVEKLVHDGLLKSDEPEMLGDDEHCRFTQAKLPVVLKLRKGEGDLYDSFGPYTVTICYGFNEERTSMHYGISVCSPVDQPYKAYGRAVAWQRWSAVQRGVVRDGFSGEVSTKGELPEVLQFTPDTSAARLVLEMLSKQAKSPFALREGAKWYIDTQIDVPEPICTKCHDTGVVKWEGKGRNRVPVELCDCDTGKERGENPEAFEEVDLGDCGVLVINDDPPVDPLHVG